QQAGRLWAGRAHSPPLELWSVLRWQGDRFDVGLDGVTDQFSAAASAGLIPDPLQMRSPAFHLAASPLFEMPSSQSPLARRLPRYWRRPGGVVNGEPATVGLD